jgi:tRNA nucleotidyltransferase/poly(A) polymerase
MLTYSTIFYSDYSMDLFHNSTDFIQLLNLNGAEVYAVGGSVRDKLFNQIHKTALKIKDYDLLVRCLEISQIMKLLKPYGKIKEVGDAFGIIVFHHRKLNKIFEIALPRIERSTGHTYKDFVIEANPHVSLELDLSRRDSTINAIAHRIFSLDDMFSETIDEKLVYDPFCGREDIAKKVWKTVGDAYKRFYEDPTRILRAIRQCSTMDLTLDDLTMRTIIDDKILLKNIKDNSLTRLSSELVKMIMGDYFGKWVRFLFESGIGSCLGLDYKDSDIDFVSNAISRTLPHDIHYVSKIATILLPLGTFAEEWITKYQLSAAQSFDAKYIDTLIKIISLVPKINSMLEHNGSSNLTKLQMRQLIQNIQQPQYNFYATKFLLDTYICCYNSGHDMLSLFDAEKDIILGTQFVVLSGQQILTIIKENTKFTHPKNIGKAKQWLFDQITNSFVDNIASDLETHLIANIGTIDFTT